MKTEASDKDESVELKR
jgi:hypothetical protein